MGLFKRMSDIVSANLNEMAEKYEDPEKMLKQAVREMETSIEQARRDVARSMASDKVVATQLAENQRQADHWQSRAESAIEAGDDQACPQGARAGKQEYEKIAAALKDQHLVATESSVTLRRQLEAMQAKLSEAKRQLGTLTARKKAADVRSKVNLGTAAPDLNHAPSPSSTACVKKWKWPKLRRTRCGNSPADSRAKKFPKPTPPIWKWTQSCGS